MLVEKLSANDIRLIDDYRKNYAFSSEANETCGTFMDTPYILREWDHQKSQYLFKMFGEQFTISRRFNYTKSYEQLQDEIADFINRRYGRVGRSGELFTKKYMDFIYPNGYCHSDNFPENAKEGLNRLISDDCLIFNKYDGAPFDLELPDGHKLRVSSGAKTSKMLGKIANAFDIPGYEDFRICHSQVLNQKSLTGMLTLSIHPLDYMTMSDNECDWDSCMSWRGEGGYRMGTVEMMNSPAVVVAYLTSDEEMKMWPHTGSRSEENDVWNNKKWRQLFVVNKDMIISVKDYPYHNSELTNQVVSWIRELAQQNLSWKYNDLMEYHFGTTKIHVDHLPENLNDFQIEISHGAMYNDFGCLDFHWLCVNPEIDADKIRTHSYRSTSSWYVLEYSGRSECMVCGDLGADCEDESCLACYDCQNRERCDCCGELIHGEVTYIDGMNLCEYCYENRVHECIQCGELHYDDQVRPIYVIPRLTIEESADLMEKYKADHPYDWEHIKDTPFDDCMYYQTDSEIWICDHDSCFQRWVKDNLIEGHKPHLRQIRWNTNSYVYFDELTPEAQNDYFEWANNDPDAYKRSFQWNSVYPSKFVEDYKLNDDDLPF